MLTTVGCQILLCFTVTWFSLRTLHMIESIERLCLGLVFLLYISFLLHTHYTSYSGPGVVFSMQSVFRKHSFSFTQVRNAISIWCPDHPYTRRIHLSFNLLWNWSSSDTSECPGHFFLKHVSFLILSGPETKILQGKHLYMRIKVHFKRLE